MKSADRASNKLSSYMECLLDSKLPMVGNLNLDLMSVRDT